MRNNKGGGSSYKGMLSLKKFPKSSTNLFFRHSVGRCFNLYNAEKAFISSVREKLIVKNEAILRLPISVDMFWSRETFT